MDNKGVTLFELIISITIGSIIIMTLMTILPLVLNIKNRAEYSNKMLNESYIINYTLQNKILEFEPHTVELTSDTQDSTVITLTHEYDIGFDEDGIIARDYSTAESKTITYDKNLQQIYFDGEKIVDDSVSLVTGTKFELKSINPSVCDVSTGFSCGNVILKISLVLSSPGVPMDPVIFETRIVL